MAPAAVQTIELGTRDPSYSWVVGENHGKNHGIFVGFIGDVHGISWIL